MIESSKNNRENYPRKCFWAEEKKPGLSANRPSNNWAMFISNVDESGKNEAH